MCLFSGDIESVSNTKIFVSPCSGNSTQLTVYSNKVSVENEAFMVLPFPGKFVKFVDLTNRKELFGDLNDYFPKTRSMALGVSRSLSFTQVGSYQAIAMQDFKELVNTSPKLNINISPDLMSFLEKNYSNFGFIVFRLMKNAEYHPFGYVHTTPNGEMFIPTMHYHSHRIDDSKSEVKTDWDHTIYTLNREVKAGLASLPGEKVDIRNRHFNYDSLPGDLQSPEFLMKYKVRGTNFPNMDLVC